jgi:hypothetical protein
MLPTCRSDPIPAADVFFRKPDDSDGPGLDELVDTDAASERDEESASLCAECDREITRRGSKTSVDGGFEHRFANPAGIVYQIGCFEQASGVGAIGEETAEHTWFDGYTWQVVICRTCTTHLGWRYWSGEHEFFGLILDRLQNL